MAWEEIVDFTVPSNTTSVTLNNFGTITKDDFIKIHFTAVSGVGTVYYALYANNDTTPSNYWRQELQALGSNVAAGRTNFSNVGVVLTNTATSIFGYLKISENSKVNFFGNSNIDNQFTQSDTRIMFEYFTSITNHSTITSLTFGSTNSTGGTISNGLGANSRIQIYRLTAEKVADITVTSNTTQVDITGLDIKKGDEYLLVGDWLNGGTTNAIALTPNDLTTRTQYYNQKIFGAGSSAGAARNNDNFLTEGFSSTRTQVYAHIKISNIGAFTFQSYGLLGSGTSGISLINYFNSSTYENITNATKLNIIDVGNSSRIATGSRFELYKLYEGGN